MRCNVFLVLSFLLTLFILIQNHVITSYYWHVLLLYNANHAFLYQQSILYEKHERDRINPALIILYFTYYYADYNDEKPLKYRKSFIRNYVLKAFPIIKE